ncbi:MAG: type II secretion system F family protein [Aquihabitans sp.]
MIRFLIAIGMCAWVGTALLLSEMRWFSRRPLDERLQPYVPGGWRWSRPSGLLSVDSFREVIGPLAGSFGEVLSRIFGVREDLATRLQRIHSPLDATAVRIRQLTWVAGTFVAAAAAVTAAGLPGPLGLLCILGGPLLAFLLVEQRVASASARWQRRLFLELPVVSEQIAMLLSSGYSLGGALDRISTRGTGACSQDLERVARRVRQGLSEADALREWADLADVAAVDRLVGVLSLNRDTGDLGRLIGDEAKGIRREVHRRLIAQIDRRAQQVWIPVTVATLVPGTLFLAVPFLQVMRLFGSS